MIDRSLQPTFEPDKDLGRLISRAVRPPIRDVRFWGVQALAIAIAFVLWLVVSQGRLDEQDVPSYVPVSLFVVPVVYAALNFGLAGSLATAVWTVLLTIPIVLPHMPQEPYLWAEASQLLVVAFVALFVGDRVEREVLARRSAEQVQVALRQLFEASPAPTVLVSQHGLILQLNAAALRLFGYTDEAEVPATLEALVGTDRARSIIADRGSALEMPGPDGGPRILQPISASWKLAEGGGMQVMFFDVSEEHRRANRADAYAAWVLRGQEEERKRIAKEIHDEPIQSLIHLCRRLDTVADTLQTPEHQREVADVRALAIRITEDLRRLSQGLRPPALDDLGLAAAVRRLASDLGRRQGIDVQLRVEGATARLDRDAELGLFRIAQEALNNVEKHAHAGVTSVALTFGTDSVVLEVKDDGNGFDTGGDWTRSGSLGLIGMQERATLLGGALSVESAARRGTRIRVELPLSPPAVAASRRARPRAAVPPPGASVGPV
ncbi:MAG: ATP-binding protein [Candidatus Dormiibacterota bacterium]